MALVARALTLLALVVTGACNEVTRWDTEGSWEGVVTLSGETPTTRSSTLSALGTGWQEDRIRFCRLWVLTLSLHFVPIEEGLPAAVQIQTDRALCESGQAEIVGGAVLIWTEIGPQTLAARPDEGWTVSGHLEIEEFRDFGLPELDVGDSATTETLSGALVLIAQDGGAGIVRIHDGSFEISVVASRVERSIS